MSNLFENVKLNADIQMNQLTNKPNLPELKLYLSLIKFQMTNILVTKVDSNKK